MLTYLASTNWFLSIGITAFSACNHRRVSLSGRNSFSPFPLFETEQNVIDTTLSDVDISSDTDQVENQRKEELSSKPQWMKCINAVVPQNARALNEAVSIVANVTREQANALIEIGAVWAKMDLLSEDDVMNQYYDEGSSSASAKYADFPAGWGSGEDNEEEMSLDDYMEMQANLRYRRILTASTIEPGTDIRIYPHPRRFPSCYEFTDRSRLLYEDTTFIVVDKPPLLPTQPEPSNYEECCPGCVNTLMGPFRTIGGEEVARPLLCHRVDSCVGGCVVMSKDGNGQKVFSDLQVCLDFFLILIFFVAPRESVLLLLIRKRRKKKRIFSFIHVSISNNIFDTAMGTFINPSSKINAKIYNRGSVKLRSFILQ